MRMRSLNRRLLHLLSFRQLQYCRRCRKWKPTQAFYETDEEGRRTLSRVCDRCQVRLPPPLEVENS